MPVPFIFLALLVLGGLAFILLIGRKRQTPEGTVLNPAPGSRESPLLGEPERKPQNLKTQARPQQPR